MRCIFCKCESSDSQKVEHIVPESLGNLSKVLPIGVVCDSCNQYFGTKIEKPFFELEEIKTLRFEVVIPNKKNKVPPVSCIVNKTYPAKLHRDINRINCEVTSKLEFSKAVREKIKLQDGQRVLIEYASLPASTTIEPTIEVSRLIAKIAVELLAFHILRAGENLDEFIDDEVFDNIRRYARYGKPNMVWPCHIRRIYHPQKRWPEEGEPDNNITFEGMFYSILPKGYKKGHRHPVPGSFLCVLAIWGVEFAINMSAPNIEVYQAWLKENCNISPLHPALPIS